MVKAQMQIQQMAFMVVAVFIFFVMFGLFFLILTTKGLKGDVNQMAKEQAIKAAGVIADMPELNCRSGENYCLDLDKVILMKNSTDYDDFWPVDSVEVYRVYPSTGKVVDCPAPNCNHYIVFNRGTDNIRKFSTYVSLCKKIKEKGVVYNKCEIGKLVIGVKKI